MPASFVREVLASADFLTSASLVLTIPAGVTIPAGNTLYIGAMISAGATRTLSTVVDSKGNTWTIDTSAGGSSLTSIAKCHATLPLVAGDTITLTWNGALVTRVATLCEFSNLDTTAGVDKVASATGTSTAPLSAATATTTQADELLVGVIGVVHGSEVPNTNQVSAGTSYTIAGRAETTGASPSHRSVVLEFRGVAATGAYTSSGSLTVTRTWAALVGAYKASAFVAHPRSSAAVIG